MKAARVCGAFVLAALAGAAVCAQDWLSNPFNDPFVQLTHGLPQCTAPIPPRYTPAEARALDHERTQRGVSCWIAGRCRLANGYMYDAELAQRVQKAVAARGVFDDDTSVWMLGQRRFIWLKGCVSRPEQITDIARLIRNIDDVEGVFLELNVGTGGTPVYATEAAPTAPRMPEPFAETR